MYKKRDNKKCSFLRGCTLLGSALALLISIFLSGCSANTSNLMLSNIILSPNTSVHYINEYQKEADLLFLVNSWNSMDKNYVPRLAYYNEDIALDIRAFNDFVELLEDCRAAGCDPYICSAYRSCEKQHELHEIKVYHLTESGMDESLARETAAREVARPGTSEHQLGLAVDLIDSGYGVLDEAQEDTPTQQWLMENSWRYGFILRYPEGKSEITGIIYEPWHYRYVGKDTAEDIYKSGLCFEEWLEERAQEHLSIVSDR